MGTLNPIILLPDSGLDRDDAGPIGAMPVQACAEVMRVGYNREVGGELVYVEEMPVRIAMVWRIVDTGRGDRHAWWRLEVKVESNNNTIRSGHTLILAEHPYGNGWVQWTNFKAALQKGENERPDPSLENFHSFQEFQKWIDGQRHDFWEKGRYLTAAVSEPDLPFEPGPGLRNIGHRALWVLGSCDSAPEFETTLYGTDKVQRLLMATENGTIKFSFKGAKLSIRPTVLEEIKAEAPSLMLLSIRQALAGPHANSTQWFGRPVVDKVDHIYRAHLNNRNRQCAGEHRRSSDYDKA